MSDQKNKIAGKVVVITGASSGLGEAAARLLAKEGAKVALGARRGERLKKLVDELDRNGGKALAVVFAMSQPEEVDVNEILFRPTRQLL
ncbi:MAG TPA: SDR family NAD(P)-dependent oxidoreductase [Candidatus Udaeobacter sp.]|jgi:NADP-dependent 3-hydroxy acid dehydrogenase YdfG